MLSNGVERSGVHDEPTSDPDRQGQSNGHPRDGYGPPHPLDGVAKQIREVVEYANLYVETRKDMVRSTIRSLIWKAAAGVVAAVAGVTVIVVSAVYLLSGIAHGLGRLLGNEFWLGELITAVTIFLILGIAGWLTIKSMNRKARERTLKKYERRQQQQRQRFGHSTTERAQQIQQTHRG